jgi:hypothetical protein
MLADWLDENGFETRADYIRRSIHLHNRPVAGPTRDRREPAIYSITRGASIPHRRDPEEVAVHELMLANRAAWSWPIGDLNRNPRRQSVIFAITRGFVSEIHLPTAWFVRDAGALFSVLPITTVRLPHLYDAHDDVLYDASMTRRGTWNNRVPGEVFPFLARVHLGVTIRGAEATIPGCVAGTAAARAAVAYGRHQAGLPPLTREEFDVIAPARPPEHLTQAGDEEQ